MHGLRHSGGRSSRGAQQLEQAREAQCGQEPGGRGLINQLFSRHANRSATDAPHGDVAQGLLGGRLTQQEPSLISSSILARFGL